MILSKTGICLTKKESKRVTELFATLSGMGGTGDEDFDDDCQDAQIFYDKINDLLKQMK